jgi:hypothetical protein
VSVQNDSHVCAQCGSPKPNYYAKQCRSCWLEAKRKESRRCQDCGKLLHTTVDGRADKRCWPCFRTWRAAQRPITVCTVDGCDKPFYAKGKCRSHYVVHRRLAFYDLTVDRKAHALVKEQPCAVCGYSRMPSEPHRIIPGGPYELGNMVPVCSRCHDEIERGLTPCPPPWRPE